jgi:AcrR family transcriptional regulator
LDLKEHIIEQADKLFHQYGIKSVTMDDIAKHLGMSKKTIYIHFSDKNELVHTLIKRAMDEQNCVMDRTHTSSENAVDEVFKAVTEVQEMLSNMNPMFLFDMQKYHPQAWLVFREFREKKLYKVIRDNLQRGIKEKLYRKEINADILTRMRLEQIDMIFTHPFFRSNKYSVSQAMAEITEHFLYGICTLKGHKLINNYKHVTEED